MHLLYEDAAPEKKVEDAPEKKAEDAPEKKAEDAPEKKAEDAPEKKAEDAADVEMKGMDVVAGIDHRMAMFAFEQQGVGVPLCHWATSC